MIGGRLPRKAVSYGRSWIEVLETHRCCYARPARVGGLQRRRRRAGGRDACRYARRDADRDAPHPVAHGGAVRGRRGRPARPAGPPDGERTADARGAKIDAINADGGDLVTLLHSKSESAAAELC